MGRPPKYKTVEEQLEARKFQKRVWYANHRDVIKNRRARKRKAVAAAITSRLSPTPTSGDDDDLLDREESDSVGGSSYTQIHKRLDLVDCIPSTLCCELRSARRLAPLASRVEFSCTFWNSFLQSFTRGGLVSVVRTIFHDLSEMSDDDVVKSVAYAKLETNLELTEQMINDVFRHAADTDPSGRGGSYRFALDVYKRAQRVSEAICELIILRRGSAESLVSVASLPGALACSL